jgi:hypothetical protein
MTPIRFEIDKLRREVLHLLRETKGIMLLTRPMSRTEIRKIAAKEEELHHLSKAELRRLRGLYKKQLTKVRREYGLRLSASDILKLLDRLEAVPEGQVTYLPLWVLRQWFEHSDRVIPPPSEVFYHAYIAIDATGNIYSKPDAIFTARYLEASLFEDMCALYNLARQSHLSRAEDESAKTLKQRLALQRATVIAAFNMLEAYLNGIAFDHVELESAAIADEAKAILTEWDERRQRPKYISLREKLLSYPKLILHLEHPPLQESNCDELKYLVETAKELRDAIVHASRRPNLETIKPEKEIAVYGVEFETVERIVDATINLIRKIEDKVNHSDHRIVGWLYGRSSDGAFSDSTFG